jgi:uncharacterized membrane protein YagU involved in acid resistance
MTTANTTRKDSGDLTRIILLAGLLVGTLDLSAALINFYVNTHKDPTIVLRYIASAVFGKTKAYSGEINMLFMGAIFHYLIAYFFTILFFILYLNFNIMSKNRLITGIAYGILIWAVMNLIVVPIALNIYVKWNKQTWINLLILICMIGIPLSFIAHWYFKKKVLTYTGKPGA